MISHALPNNKINNLNLAYAREMYMITHAAVVVVAAAVDYIYVCGVDPIPFLTISTVPFAFVQRYFFFHRLICVNTAIFVFFISAIFFLLPLLLLPVYVYGHIGWIRLIQMLDYFVS